MIKTPDILVSIMSASFGSLTFLEVIKDLFHTNLGLTILTTPHPRATKQIVVSKIIINNQLHNFVIWDRVASYLDGFVILLSKIFKFSGTSTLFLVISSDLIQVSSSVFVQ